MGEIGSESVGEARTQPFLADKRDLYVEATRDLHIPPYPLVEADWYKLMSKPTLPFWWQAAFGAFVTLLVQILIALFTAAGKVPTAQWVTALMLAVACAASGHAVWQHQKPSDEVRSEVDAYFKTYRRHQRAKAP